MTFFSYMQDHLAQYCHRGFFSYVIYTIWSRTVIGFFTYIQDNLVQNCHLYPTFRQLSKSLIPVSCKFPWQSHARLHVVSWVETFAKFQRNQKSHGKSHTCSFTLKARLAFYADNADSLRGFAPTVIDRLVKKTSLHCLSVIA